MVTRLFVLAFLALPASLLAEPTRYQIVDLGTLQPAHIAGDGTVAGSVFTTTQQAAIASPGLPLTPLPFLPEGTFSLANAINNGTVVGYSGTGRLSLQTHAFAWDAAQGSHDLGTLTGDPTLFSAATSLNSAATIAGYATRPLVGGGGDERRPVAWVARRITDLGTLGGAEGFAQAMNEQGDIVGNTQTSHGVFHATLWPVDGPAVDLDTLGSTSSEAYAVNSTRQVVGSAIQAGQRARAFLWTPAMGRMQDLGTLLGDAGSMAYGINDAGLIVGTSMPPAPTFPPPPSTAVLWEQGGIVDLNTRITAPDWHLTVARSINTAGWIVGTGTYQGMARAFVLVPAMPPVQIAPPREKPPQDFTRWRKRWHRQRQH